jgi:hypothetical protein
MPWQQELEAAFEELKKEFLDNREQARDEERP